jgi:hypothetical protein
MVRIINVMIFWKGNLDQKTIYMLSLSLLFSEGLLFRKISFGISNFERIANVKFTLFIFEKRFIKQSD